MRDGIAVERESGPEFFDDTAALGEDFAREVLSGLAKARKAIPSRFLYDARGSELFEQITYLSEYYPTRTEIALLKRHAPALADRTPAGSALIEFGSGSSRKTEILLDQLDDLALYVPLDVSKTALSDAKARLARRFPNLRVKPMVADFSQDIDLPAETDGLPRLGFFPGSTIGNLTPVDAQGLLGNFAKILQREGRLVIGVDLKKDKAVLDAAYDDSEGVTAAFNLNLLERMNRELGADFDVRKFVHSAEYSAERGRVELHLVAIEDQNVSILGQTFRFKKDERIHTENSNKYTVAEFRALAASAGWTALNSWTDENRLFSVHELSLAT